MSPRCLLVRSMGDLDLGIRCQLARAGSSLKLPVPFQNFQPLFLKNPIKPAFKSKNGFNGVFHSDIRLAYR